MKYFVFLILIGLVAITSVNVVSGLWVPETPDELFKQSETVFVGTVTSVHVLEFERSNTFHIEENGVTRIEIENYTQTLDEYTVDIEEFLKNPQESNTITMLEATVGGVPGRSVSIGGFELGDRVLFYVPKIDGTNQYSPESFEIPKQCDAKSVLEQPRVFLFNDFKIMQDGIEKNDNFTANKPIEFVYNKDMNTLEGKSFDVNIKISKITGNDWETAIHKNIHAESKPCEWTSTARWEFVPTVGRYYMWMETSEGNRVGGETVSREFNVIEDISSQTKSVFPLLGYPAWNISPLKQFSSGIPFYEIQCKETLLLIKKYDGTPICVTPETREKLIERGWSGTLYVAVNREAPTVYFDPVDISSANNQFAVDFYSNLTQNDSVSNVFFSPTSISTAFSILYEGARQNTSQEIQNVFGFPEDDQIRRHGYLSLHQSINEKSNTDTKLSIANALWLAENFEPLAEYIDTATTFYDSEVDTVDFASDEGVNKINEWVDEKTQGKITDILKPGSTGSNTKMAITNAIYFKGLWEYPFDPEDTYDSEFMVDKDNSVNVQMMTFPHKMQVSYTVTETMEMIELPYRNGTLSLLVILPNEIDDLRTVEESITVDNLKMWKDFPTVNRGINIHIPKFTLETEYDLTEQLPDMGMPTVFNPVHADLSGITGYKGLYVSQAIHKAFVEVNEKGTEAAGATVIVTDESGGSTFRADHPFIFIIQDNETDSILFMGRVTDPTK
jgi:serpin B